MKGYMTSSFDLNIVDNKTLNLFEKRLKKLIIKDLVFRLEKTNQENILIKTKAPLNEIYDKVILNGYQPINNQDLLEKTYQSGNLISCMVNEKQKKLFLCWNHAILDGLGARNILINIFKPINTLIKPIPVIKSNVFILCFSLIKLFLNYNRLTKIKPAVLFSDCEKSRIFTFSINTQKLNDIVKHKKCSFNAAIQSIIFEYIYDYCNHLNVVIIFGGEKTVYFNNHAVIPYTINLRKNKDNIENKIDQLLKQNSFCASINLNKRVASFLKQKNKVNRIDIMFSGAPFSKERLYLGESYILNHKGYIPYHNIPFYVGSVKLEDQVHFTIGVRDRKLQNFLKRYNWNILE